MIVAIDLSEDGGRVIALVGVREHVLKRGKFSAITATLKHYREVHSKRKTLTSKHFPEDI